jgi:hypothetical protein
VYLNNFFDTFSLKDSDYFKALKVAKDAATFCNRYLNDFSMQFNKPNTKPTEQMFN